MFTPQAGRLLRKVLVLVVLLAGLAVLNTESGVRKVAAQPTCCQGCADSLPRCLDFCRDPYCAYQCYGKYNVCRSTCNPPCS